MCHLGFLTLRRARDEAGGLVPTPPGPPIPPADAAPSALASLAFARRLADFGRPFGIAVVAFTPDDLRPDGTVRAVLFSGRSVRRATIPMPEAVYDFVRTQPTDAFRRYLAARKAGRWPSPSRGGSEKWRLDRILRASPLAPHLPETILWTGDAEARASAEALLAGGDVIIKPRAGTGGRGVVRIPRDTPPSALRRALGALPPGRHLLQRYIPHAAGDRVYDVRVLVQKTPDGVFRPTGAGVRTNDRRRFVTNLARGGRALPLNAYLLRVRRFSPARAETLQHDLFRLATAAAEALEAGLGPLVEVALDVVIDPEGRLFIVEANTKPGRELFRLLGDRAAYRLSHLRPLFYLCAWARNTASIRRA
ncbi:MAG: hypothetical protein HSCHL_1259 [Hydrogenibacillus schlegelii]|uniref:ATP-grasp domain-containing protein n=1 Tax=Hydrogenibacillus schlegelii TaxID=1484 RepID=A0A2T5GCJ5_HYDSH|nr:YheC/YheD family protein [Hydrogenibacillus schlegelii]PTQ53885.1 MAG: hypothetical protein HSCHL_1259 [Hydrogenibacillus schlegelii]